MAFQLKRFTFINLVPQLFGYHFSKSIYASFGNNDFMQELTFVKSPISNTRNRVRNDNLSHGSTPFKYLIPYSCNGIWDYELF